MYCFQASNGNYLSFIKIPAWLSVIHSAFVLHTDHLGNVDNYNARSKFPAQFNTDEKSHQVGCLLLPRR